jgi:uncharacterized protein
MRIVATRADDGDPAVPRVLVAEPDERRRLPGRGAWLHPSPDCLDLAVRRRAFARALRVPGPLDTTALAVVVGQQQDQQDSTISTTPGRGSDGPRRNFGTGSGLPR